MVAAWSVAYVGRLPAVMLPSPVLFVLLAAVPVLAGRELRRRTGGSLSHAAMVGPLALGLHLPVLAAAGTEPVSGELGAGSTFAALVAGLIGAAALSGLGGSLAALRFGAEPAPIEPIDPRRTASSIALLAALLHLGASAFQGNFAAAIEIWPEPTPLTAPLLPIALPAGPLLYSDAGRPLLSLALLATLGLVATLELCERRRRVRWLARLAALLIGGRLLLLLLPVADGGGWGSLMVPAIFDPVHLVLVLAVVVATGASRGAGEEPVPLAIGDRLLPALLLALLVTQLGLGLLQRQAKGLLPVHMLLGGTLVLAVAVRVGIRTFLITRREQPERRLGLLLLIAIAIQVGLGLLAFVVPGVPGWAWPPVVDATLTTVHQWLGALLVALAVALIRPTSG